MIKIAREKNKNGQPRDPGFPALDKIAREARGGEDSRDAYKRGENPRAEQPRTVPDESERGIRYRQQRSLGVEEIPVRHPAFGDEIRRIKVPALVLIQPAEPYGGRDENKTGESACSENLFYPFHLHLNSNP